jgi:hypothetical protein
MIDLRRFRYESKGLVSDGAAATVSNSDAADLCARVDARLVELGWDPFPDFPELRERQNQSAIKAWKAAPPLTAPSNEDDSDFDWGSSDDEQTSEMDRIDLSDPHNPKLSREFWIKSHDDAEDAKDRKSDETLREHRQLFLRELEFARNSEWRPPTGECPPCAQCGWCKCCHSATTTITAGANWLATVLDIFPVTHEYVLRQPDDNNDVVQGQTTIWTLRCGGRTVRCGPVSPEAELDESWLHSYLENACRACCADMIDASDAKLHITINREKRKAVARTPNVAAMAQANHAAIAGPDLVPRSAAAAVVLWPETLNTAGGPGGDMPLTTSQLTNSGPRISTMTRDTTAPGAEPHATVSITNKPHNNAHSSMTVSNPDSAVAEPLAPNFNSAAAEAPPLGFVSGIAETTTTRSSAATIPVPSRGPDETIRLAGDVKSVKLETDAQLVLCRIGDRKIERLPSVGPPVIDVAEVRVFRHPEAGSMTTALLKAADDAASKNPNGPPVKLYVLRHSHDPPDSVNSIICDICRAARANTELDRDRPFHIYTVSHSPPNPNL